MSSLTKPCPYAPATPCSSSLETLGDRSHSDARSLEIADHNDLLGLLLAYTPREDLRHLRNALGQTAVFLSALAGDYKTTLRLLEAGADPSVREMSK
jgi:hypothetical protein